MKQLEDIYNRVVEATLEASGLTFEQLGDLTHRKKCYCACGND